MPTAFSLVQDLVNGFNSTTVVSLAGHTENFSSPDTHLLLIATTRADRPLVRWRAIVQTMYSPQVDKRCAHIQ